MAHWHLSDYDLGRYEDDNYAGRRGGSSDGYLGADQPLGQLVDGLAAGAVGFGWGMWQGYYGQMPTFLSLPLDLWAGIVFSGLNIGFGMMGWIEEGGIASRALNDMAVGSIVAFGTNWGAQLGNSMRTQAGAAPPATLPAGTPASTGQWDYSQPQYAYPRAA